MWSGYTRPKDQKTSCPYDISDCKEFLLFLLPEKIKMGRILGIDYGKKRIGIAVTDPLQIFASPLATVSPSEFDGFIENYLRSEKIDAFVIGYPRQMNNQPSESVRYINPFIVKIKKKYPEIDVHCIDERFTSQIAMKSMISGGVKKSDRQDKSMVDRISASIILQSYLDTLSNKKSNI